jgi:hypothetical protein
MRTGCAFLDECGCPLDQFAPLGDALDLDECVPARFVPPDAPCADLNILQPWPEGTCAIEEARHDPDKSSGGKATTQM